MDKEKNDEGITGGGNGCVKMRRRACVWQSYQEGSLAGREGSSVVGAKGIFFNVTCLLSGTEICFRIFQQPTQYSSLSGLLP